MEIQNEQVEEQKKRPNGQKDCPTIDSAAGWPSQTANEAGGTRFASNLFSETMKCA
jgi:hypothetical protein